MTDYTISAPGVYMLSDGIGMRCGFIFDFFVNFPNIPIIVYIRLVNDDARVAMHTSSHLFSSWFGFFLFFEQE